MQNLETIQEGHAGAIAALQSEVSAEKEARSGLESALAAAPQASDVEALHKALDDAQSAIAENAVELTRARDSLASEIPELKQSVTTLEAQLEAVGAQRHRLAEELEDTKSNTESQVKSLEAVYTVQIDELERTVTSQREKIADFEKRFADGDATSAGLAEDLKKEHDKREAATKELEALSEENWSVKKAKDDLAKERDALLQQLADARALAEKGLAEEMAAKEALEKRVAALLEEVAAIRSESQGASQATANEMEASLKEAETALDVVSKEKDDLAAEGEKQRQTLGEKDAVIERLTKEHEEYESEIPSLKKSLGLAQALAEEKGAALDNLRKEHEAQLDVLQAELAEARLRQGTGTAGDGEVSTSTGDMGTPCHPPEGGAGEDEGVVAIVRSPIV